MAQNKVFYSCDHFVSDAGPSCTLINCWAPNHPGGDVINVGGMEKVMSDLCIK